METYNKHEIPPHSRQKRLALYGYNDPGRFDVCRGCPLKLAVKALKNR